MSSISVYIEIAILLLFFILGGPVNLHVFQRLRTSTYKRLVSPSFRLLQQHLNVSDLLVLFIYVPSTLCWRITNDWRATVVLCKAVSFANVLCFHISSNIIVCIAVDRFSKLLFTNQRRHSCCHSSLKRVRYSLAAAWMLAVACSLPQLYFWEIYQPEPSDNSKVYCQHKFVVLGLRYEHSANTSSSVYEMSQEEYSQFELYVEKVGLLTAIYSSFHLASVFYIPAFIVIICYGLILIGVCSKSTTRQTNTTSVNRKTILKKENSTSSNTNQRISFFNNNNNKLTTSGGNGNCADKSGLSNSNCRNDKVNSHPMALSTAVINHKKEVLIEYGHMNGKETSASGDINNKQRRQNSSITANNDKNNYELVRKHRTKAFRLATILVLVYLLCWSPYNVITFMSNTSNDDVIYYLHQLIVFNSVVNPYLYGIGKTATKINE